MLIKVSFFTVLISVFGFATSFGQFINMDQTINYINGKFKGSCAVDTKNADMVIRFYQNNEKIREDRAPFEMLDQESVEYNSEEKAIIIKCYDREECIFRKLEKDNFKDYYKRLNIPYEGDSISQKGLEKAFKHLILLVKYDSYKSNEPFE